MAGGKFSQPRPHRDEERQIEQAFRQVTGQAPTVENPILKEPIPSDFRPESPVSQDTLFVEQSKLEEALQQLPQQLPPMEPIVPPPPAEPAFEPMHEDMELFFEDPVPEEAAETQPDFLDKLLAFANQLTAPGKKQTAVLLAICGISLLVIVSCIALFFAGAADPNDGKILENVYLANIPVGGMTKAEAISAVKEATSLTYGSQDMVIDLSGTELRLSPKETKVKLDAKAAVNAAYDYGRSGTEEENNHALAMSRQQPYYIGLLPYLDMDEDYILDTLTTCAQDTGSTLTQPTYGLEGKEPELSADKFNENTPTQTLVIRLGTPGIGFDVKDVYEKVLDAFSLHGFLVTVENVESVRDPDAVDLQKIYKEFYIEPVDARMNHQTFEAIPGSYGYGFDLEKAQKLLDQAQFGDEIRIPMEYIAPEVLNADAFYRDVLGDHQTRHTGNDDRNTNLQLACAAINGTVIEPGKTFSFNQTVGQRTSARGYKTAPADVGFPGETTLGGGVSQVSSTLYYAALLSDLEVTSRSAGTYAPDFIDFGFDAIVSWDLYDLSIRNNMGYPIMIQANVSGGYVRVKILGTEERNHYVMLDYEITKTSVPETDWKEYPHDNDEGYEDGDLIREGITGYTVKTYKNKYDAATNEKRSRDFIATTEYRSENKLVAEVLPEETTAPTEAPTTVPPTTTAPPPSTEAPVPVETTAPPAEPDETQPPVQTEAVTEPQEEVAQEIEMPVTPADVIEDNESA